MTKATTPASRSVSATASAIDFFQANIYNNSGFSPSLCPKYPEILLPSTGFHNNRPFLKSIPVDSRRHLNMSQR